MMIIETYIATIKHDKGTIRLRIATLSGKQGAIEQIRAVENCPERANMQLKMIGKKII